MSTGRGGKYEKMINMQIFISFVFPPINISMITKKQLKIWNNFSISFHLFLLTFVTSICFLNAVWTTEKEKKKFK